jgi:hypothetical protein
MLTGADGEAIMGIHLAHRDRMSAGKIADQHLIQRHSPVQRFFQRPHADLVDSALVDECSRGWAYAASPLETSDIGLSHARTRVPADFHSRHFRQRK